MNIFDQLFFLFFQNSIKSWKSVENFNRILCHPYPWRVNRTSFSSNSSNVPIHMFFIRYFALKYSVFGKAWHALKSFLAKSYESKFCKFQQSPLFFFLEFYIRSIFTWLIILAAAVWKHFIFYLIFLSISLHLKSS
jgi:hypothetical protein